MDGLILIHKPKDVTSHDVVARIRKIINQQKVGHYGTLDPLATGLLIIALGKATRLFPFYSKKDKSYTGQLMLGFSTDTYDSMGKTTSEVTTKYPQKKLLLETMRKFEGEIFQVPPAFSAKKYQGKPSYILARKNQRIELKPQKIKILFFHGKKYTPPFLDFEVRCSTGTYIRSLVHELGQDLSCGAHLTQLIRTETAGFTIRKCLKIEQIEHKMSSDKFSEFLIPMQDLLPEFPKITLNPLGLKLAKNGNLFYPENITSIDREDKTNEFGLENVSIFRVFSQEGAFIALAKKGQEKICFHPFLVLDSA